MKRYWLRGGVTGVGVAFALLAIMFISDAYMQSLFWLFKIVEFIAQLDFISLFVCEGFCTGYANFTHLFFIWPSFFIIGAISGLIYGKIKNIKLSPSA